MAIWSQWSCVPSYESKVGILNLEGRGWLVMDVMKGELVLWTRSSTWFALLMEVFISSMALFIWSISLSLSLSLSLQVRYSTSGSSSRMISSLNVFVAPSFSEFCPCSSPWRCQRCLLTLGFIASSLPLQQPWTITVAGQSVVVVVLVYGLGD